MTDQPLAIDLFCGLFGWAEGLTAEGWRIVGFDLEDMCGQFRIARPQDVQLVVQDVLTLDGAQFRDAALIVASPPCQEYSYMAMPWTRAKAIAAALKGEGEFPDGYSGSRTLGGLNALFDACFRIQREACEAAGRHIPLIVENVRGAQPWVGRARWNFGSYYLWGDVPALMPPTVRAQKANPDGTDHGTGSWFAVADSKERGAQKNPGFRFDGSGRSFQSESVKQHGSGHAWFDKALDQRRKNPGGRKNPGIELGDIGFNVASARQFGHMVEGVKIERSADDKRQHIGTKRKFASAMIARIPEPLSRHIAAVFMRAVMEARAA